MSAPLHDIDRRGFASDNYAGVHPEVIAAIAEANGGHQSSYGADVYTARLQKVMQGHFGPAAQTFPVFNGTGANVLALQSLMPRWGAVICPATAHVNVDEGGAPERIGGMKLLSCATPDGKLTPDIVRAAAGGRGDEHRAQPLAVSITQSSELGTLYDVEQVRAIAETAHELGMALHMDGSRLSNAAVGLGLAFRDFTTDAGVDILSLGATKNGALGAEAVVVLDPERVPGIDHALTYARKYTMQLSSKMRFMSAQLLALYDGDLWQRNAGRANAMARRLRDALEGAPGLEFTQPTQANGLFVRLPAGVADPVREHYMFYDWDEASREVRWMCSFDTTEDDVDTFAALVRSELDRRA